MSCGECESTELMPSKQPDPADVGPVVAEILAGLRLDTADVVRDGKVTPTIAERIAAMHSWETVHRSYFASLTWKS